MNIPNATGPVPPDTNGLDDERREDNRHCTVFRIARIARESDAGLWRVRNISDHGMMLATTVAVSPGEPLQIALSDTITLVGKVVWARDGRCGVEFDAPVDALDILRQLAAERQSGDYRPPRLPVHGRALAVTEDGDHDVEIENLSQNGAGVIHAGGLETGTELLLVLGEDIRRRGIVRWSRSDPQGNWRAGIWFAPPLAPGDLESIRRFQS